MTLYVFYLYWLMGHPGLTLVIKIIIIIIITNVGDAKLLPAMLSCYRLC